MREDLDIDPDTGGVSYAEGRARWDYLTIKIVLLLDACTRAKDYEMVNIWGRHASALLTKRDRYKAYAYRG